MFLISKRAFLQEKFKDPISSYFCNIVIFSKVATTVFNKSLEDGGKGS